MEQAYGFRMPIAGTWRPGGSNARPSTTEIACNTFKCETMFNSLRRFLIAVEIRVMRLIARSRSRAKAIRFRTSIALLHKRNLPSGYGKLASAPEVFRLR